MPGKKGRVFYYLLACNYAVLGCVVFHVDVVSAQTSSSDFTDVALERRYVTLIQELRCPKCQNQNDMPKKSQLQKVEKTIFRRPQKKGM